MDAEYERSLNRIEQLATMGAINEVQLQVALIEYQESLLGTDSSRLQSFQSATNYVRFASQSVLISEGALRDERASPGFNELEAQRIQDLVTAAAEKRDTAVVMALASEALRKYTRIGSDQRGAVLRRIETLTESKAMSEGWFFWMYVGGALLIAAGWVIGARSSSPAR